MRLGHAPRKPLASGLALDSVRSARLARLRYVSDGERGIRRVRKGRGFVYIGPSGRPVADEKTLRRIRSLVLPPAWQEVWISPDPRAHLQATGRDARGRKQYRYHPRFREIREETKYGRLLRFGRALPALRRRLARDLALPGLSKRKVLATVVKLLQVTLIRVGNDEYARQNKHFGLTTMRDRHVEIRGPRLRFRFKGKRGVLRDVALTDERLSRIVRRCQDLPGQELFQYVDAQGVVRDITSSDVNEYLKEIMGEDFTAKDFRTWAGTVLAAKALQELESFDSKAQAKRNVVRAIEAVASRLGNTRAICKKCYVHPLVVEAYLDGSLLRLLKQRTEKELKGRLSRLSPEEGAVLAFLQERLGREIRLVA